MSEHIKAILSAVVIVGCLALLGLMVYLKVDGAAVGALGTITVIIAWLTRTPDRKDPPIAPKLIPLIAAGGLLTGLLACGCDSFTAKDASDATKTGLSVVQKACIFANAFMPRAKLAEWCEVSGPYLRFVDEMLPAAKAAQAASMHAGATPKPVICASTNNGVECWETTR